MKETLRLVRVFLASPGDLSNERRLVKDAVDEINRRIAPHFGFRVELLGWEDTLPGAGRPQSLINQDLDRCELFVGMIWKRWGTPPSTKDLYSSGFQEEFVRSLSRLQDTGEPEIAMFFKDIGSELTIGTGEDFKKIGEDIEKVKEFQEQLMQEKSIYYKNFNDSNELQGYVREKITDYLIGLKNAETENNEVKQAKTKHPSGETDTQKNQDFTKSPFSVEGHSFLKEFLEKTEAEDSAENITSLEVARFRLLSNAISKSGNDEQNLGVHDANIIYSNKQIKFGSREISRLIDCGLKNISHENAPLWHWYSAYKGIIRKGFLPFKSLSSEDVSVGALEVMKLIGTSLPIEEKYINRNYFVSEWLSENNSDNIKIAALRYLKHHGKEEDFPLIQDELNRVNSKTSKVALETLVSIQLHYNESEALKTAFTNQFESFDENILEKVLSVSLNLDDETLKLGLKHRNKRIRLESFKRLSERNKINPDEIQELKNDPCALMRKDIVDYLLLSGNQTLSDAEVKNILVRPLKTRGLGWFGTPTQSDEEGQACYDEYLFSKYSDMSENELLELIKEASIFDEIPYFALCSSYFKIHSGGLRRNVDNQFKDKFETYIKHLKNIGTPDKDIKKTRNIEDFLRKQLTRKALDILCQKGDKKDLDRIRNNMRSEYVKSSEDEVEYIRKLGSWEDIPYIVKLEKEYASTRLSLTIFANNYEWSRSISKAIYNIGKVRIGELLKTEMPPHISVDLIKICSSSKFSEIPDNILLNLLNNNEDKVRKVTSLKIIKFLKKSKIEYLLKEYTDSQEYRYYNVIFWLDFGISMPKSMTIKTVNHILDE